VSVASHEYILREETMETTNGASTKTADIGKLILRVSLGVLVLLHGVGKLISGPDFVLKIVGDAGLPMAFGYLVYLGEVLAPVLLIVGLWSRVAALVVAAGVGVAVLLVMPGQIFALADTGGWAVELEGIYVFAAIAIAFLGAGRYSIGGVHGRWN
jgi:putative oxidoreductase